VRAGATGGLRFKSLTTYLVGAASSSSSPDAWRSQSEGKRVGRGGRRVVRCKLPPSPLLRWQRGCGGHSRRREGGRGGSPATQQEYERVGAGGRSGRGSETIAKSGDGKAKWIRCGGQQAEGREIKQVDISVRPSERLINTYHYR